MKQCSWVGVDNRTCCESAWADSDVCILHSGDPEKDLTAFSQRVAQKLEVKDYQFSGVIFPNGEFRLHGDIPGADFSYATISRADFSGSKFLKPTRFTGAKFLSACDFYNVEFDDAVDFGSAEFSEKVTFFQTQFRGESNFIETKFKSASFYRSEFHNHATFRRSTMTEASFSQCVIKSLDFAFAKIGTCDYSITHFGDIADFSGTHFARGADFYRAIFANAALFHTTIFGKGKTDLRKVRFEGETNFAEAEFQDSSRFDSTEFLGRTNFSSTTFQEDSSFMYTMFSSEALFISTRWKATAQFDNATFRERAVFTGAEFGKKASFRLAKFEKGSNFNDVAFRGAEFPGAQFLGDAYFESAVFEGNEQFLYAHAQEGSFTGAATFFEAYFGGRFLLRRSHLRGAIDFSRSTFAGPALFMLLQARELSIPAKSAFTEETGVVDGKTFSISKTSAPAAELRFEHAVLEDPKSTRFDQVDLRRSVFAGCNVRSVVFHDCNWPKIRWRNAVYDEVLGVKSPEIVRLLYRDLKASLEDAHDWVLAGDFYYGEMELLRKFSRGPTDRWWRLRRFLSPYTVYWLTSGYAERPIRAMLFFMGLILVFTYLFHKATFTLQGELLANPSWAAALGHSVRVLTLQRTFFISPQSNWSHRLTLLANLLGPLQLAQIAVAVQRRFRR